MVKQIKNLTGASLLAGILGSLACAEMGAPTAKPGSALADPDVVANAQAAKQFDSAAVSERTIGVPVRILNPEWQAHREGYQAAIKDMRRSAGSLRYLASNYRYHAEKIYPGENWKEMVGFFAGGAAILGGLVALAVNNVIPCGVIVPFGFVATELALSLWTYLKRKPLRNKADELDKKADALATAASYLEAR